MSHLFCKCRHHLLCILIVMIALGWGPTKLLAQSQTPATGYGRSRGTNYQKSLNGTSVFADLFRQRGHRVRFRNVISPAIDDYQTIVWFPDSYEVPADNVVQRLQQWLSEEPERVLIYVGRDYDAAVNYWQEITEVVDGTEKREAKRQAALALSHHRWQQSIDIASNGCHWFQVTPGTPGPATNWDGIWSLTAQSDQSGIQWGAIRLTPPALQDMREYTCLLEANGEPFIFQIEEFQNDSRVIVVNNGSGLVNYGLLDHSSRILANELIESTSSQGNVLFLESGAEGLSVLQSESKATQWSWIAQAPLCYIVPHLLVLGVLALFCFFPILGRPRRGMLLPPNRFGRHIQAIGQLLERSNDTGAAMQSIERYKKLTRRDSQ